METVGDIDRQDERTPLLQHNGSQSPPEYQRRSSTTSNVTNLLETPIVDCEAGSSSPHSTSRRRLVILISFVLGMFVLESGDLLLKPAMVRIYEDTICRNYYATQQHELFPAGEDVPEEKCKIAPVQTELAFIRGLEPVFDAIPSLLVAIPLGMVADNPKIGRKPVFLAALMGPFCQMIWAVIVNRFSDIFPIRFVWFGSLFLITGGLSVINALLYTMIIDVTTPSERASTFFTMQLVGSYGPGLIMPLITTRIMESSGNWTSVACGVSLAACGYIMMSTVPETISFHNPDKDAQPELTTDTTAAESDSINSESTIPPEKQSIWLRCKVQFSEFIDSSSFVFHSPHLRILVCSLMMCMLSLTRALETLLYYASARYGITIAKANLLITVNAAVCMSVLFCLPFASAYLTGTIGISSQRKDLLIAQISVVLLAIGWYIVGLASTLPFAVVGLVVYTLGSGFSGSVRSLAASFVEPHHQARLNSFIAIMTAMGNFVGSPLLAGLYGWGVSTGNPFWFGLPFVGLGSVFAVVGFALWFRLKLPEEGGAVVVDEDEEVLLRS
ncbi:hypothetical protein TWF192_006973 [Orbilia oligospora]|uniref:Major facilitator superfamily (MFS) profile domain-containing protein n=1 Tax=Orbilia oligospora TaxID=2813651 RepID=A0A6G1M563_ORBOL|nr:hypothetical protein TWF191_007205 [Orbilia oligospora]KAF3246125.1 hypothetical protein TWF192_006973 [Orbilia oligospora]